jgi:hypothetical protein
MAFLLRPGLTRDTQETRRLAISPTAETIRLDLEVPAGAFSRYRVRLLTLDSEELWSQGLTAAPSPLRVSVPASLFRPGDYMVELQGVTSDGNSEVIAEYYFTATRRR